MAFVWEGRDWPAVVRRIVDGDTMILAIGVGFRISTEQSVRLLGISAPEVFSGLSEEREKGRASRSYLESLAPPGTACTLRTYKERKTFDRYLGSILLPDGRDLASEMVEGGYATWATP